MEAKQGSPEKTSSAGDSTSQKQEAFTHLAQGKRHLLVRDYFEAATSLAQACKLLAEQYGESANELGDAYFCYGKALLELARSESGVLGDAIEGEHDGSNDDEDDDDDEEDEEAEEQPEESGEKVENGTSAEGNQSNEDGKEGEEKKDVDKSEEKDGKEGEENGDSDDESNLKLAWEVLELAKLIFERQTEGNPKISLMLAEVYLKLGEVSLEDENHGQAIEDIKSCLKIQKENLPEDDRYVAETYYQLGVAYSLNSDFDNAIDNFKNAAGVIEKRIKNLELKKESGSDCSEETKSDPFYTFDGEIKELKELLPDILDKVSDMEDFKKETLKALFNSLGQRASGQDAGQAGGPSGSGSNVNSSPVSAESKPVTNISHLVRKKRKPEDGAGDNKGTEAAIAPPKQAKTE